MNNKEFLNVLEKSYNIYLKTSARSNKKLEVLHGEIAKDLSGKLGKAYKVKSLGFEEGKEGKVNGRYMEKAVDISVYKDSQSLGGIAVKYIMSNYSQNSNNYFENMLGETANLRCNNKAYFQIVILPKHLPYFKKDGSISKIEEITEHNLSKYIKLSEDDINIYLHTPTKTLIYLINTPKFDKSVIDTKEKYIQHFLKDEKIITSVCSDKHCFKESIIQNDYENFINKVVNYFKFLY
ncbi:MAG: hypothetical protein PHX27_04565 [Candidatus ainarchaeum sp.]|nr:hypothetical protein [Candidatus ainarchaeum sp.]